MNRIDFENGLPFGNNQQFTFHRRKFVSFCGLIFQNGKSTNIKVTSIDENSFVVSEITKKLAIRTNTVLFDTLDCLNSANSFFPPETVFKDNFCGNAVLGVTRFLKTQRILDHNEQYQIIKNFFNSKNLGNYKKDTLCRLIQKDFNSFYHFVIDLKTKNISNQQGLRPA